MDELTAGEHLLIWRRREGITQQEAGERLGVSRNTYGLLEQSEEWGKREKPSLQGELYSYEKCLIWRRRSGWTIPMCAEQIGVSRYWYNQMELGKVTPDTLIEYWVENAG